MKKIELLAPAGSMESLHAAVQNGADAVYLGGAKFSARAYASNFDKGNMIKAVEYCHLYNVKIYVTVNTLIKEDEIKEALEYIKFLYEIGVDALIIQDTGIAELVSRNFPDFHLHASTQMTVHNGEGAILLKKLGFSRIVLSRELGIDEIKYISKDLDIETEVFIHGALCISYSGQCLMSSLIGGRSGNRGRCAQPCRLPYEIIDKISGKNKKGYILSPKDICTIENIKDLIESGTSSLKIEGRMKRPEYVAGVVASYRNAIDKAYESSQCIDNSVQIKEQKLNIEVNSWKSHYKENEKYNPEKEKKKLLQLFNREGFSKAYLFGNVGKDMMAYNFPKNTGVEIGKINRDMTIILKEDIHLQDGIRVNEGGFTISKILKESKPVEEAFAGDIVLLKPSKYKSGDILYKTSDVRLLQSLSKSYSNAYEHKNDLKLIVKFRVSSPFTLKAEYEGETFEYEAEIVQEALKKPLDKEKIINNLRKTGDTAFNFKEIEFEVFEEGFMPVSAINSARRELIEKIESFIKNKDKKTFKREIDFNRSPKKIFKDDIESPLVVVTTKEQLKAAQELKIENIAVEMFMRDCSINLDEVKCKNIFIKTPSIIKGEFESLCSKIEEKLPYIKGIITSNLGIINRFKDKTLIIGDYKLNNFNSYGVEFYKDCLDMISISVELNKKEISNLVKKALLPSMMLVYGKIELMISEYCTIGSVFGGKDRKRVCSRECEEGSFVLKDRMGEEFPVKTDKYCRSHIYNGAAVNLIPNLDEIKKLKVDLLRADFIDESYEETLEILKDLKEGAFNKDFKGFTRGHFRRGVE
ncbi:U32 family peptidase [Clostridium sp. MB40-C1]|uniref:U32 family peptidase n=1 Tax=Clostridium sp. MB40-C1 TaxID=3070996 RepID=UPI0027E12DA7|nr:U32 family peptidase [Clostridium sp. MB40-C1]WMJ81157.1 U32 family peptidase [Clostridium sp. MB40-C1]